MFQKWNCKKTDDKEMKKRLLIAVVILSLGFCGKIFPSGNRSETAFDHLSIADGLSQGIVKCILQDSRGFMWFGTLNGLNKYDGYNFTVYLPELGNPRSLSHQTVSALHEGRDGSLWIGTDNGLNRYHRGADHFVNYRHRKDDPNSLSHNRISGIAEDRHGILWLATWGGGLNRFDHKKGIFKHYLPEHNNPGSISGIDIKALLVDRDGIVWTATRGGGVCALDPKTGIFRRYRNTTATPHSLSSNATRALYRDSNGTLWVGTLRGLDKYDREKDAFVNVLAARHFQPPPGRFPLITINAICEEPPGILWLGTMNYGLIRFDTRSNRWERYQNNPFKPYSLSNNSISSFFRDRSSVLWIGTSGSGLDIYLEKKEKLNHYRHMPGTANSLNHNAVWTILEDNSGEFWVGTARGLNRWDRKNRKFTYYNDIPGVPGSLSNDYVNSICQDLEGTVWVGTTRGLNRFSRQTGQFTHYLPEPGNPRSLSHHHIKKVYTDSSGVLWVGTLKGLNKWNRSTGAFTRYLEDPQNPASLSGDYISDILEDRDGTLWVGTEETGLNKMNIESGSCRRYNYRAEDPGSLSSHKIISLHRDHSGNLWVGTRGGGLNKYDRKTDSFTAYTVKHGFPDNIIYGILEDRQANLWLSTNKGICRFNPRTGRVKSLNMRDGLQSYEFNSRSCFKARNGEMFFGGMNGLNSFFPGRIKDNPHIPPVVLTSFKIANKPVPIGTDSPLKAHISQTMGIVLSYGHSMFSLEFAALDYTAPEKNQYQYKLEGLNNEWVHLGNKHDITVTRLEPGKYTFRVKGSNSDGVWNNEGVSLAITITPPFWRTWWFRGLLLALLIASISQWHRWRMKKLAHQLTEEARFNRICAKHNISKREQEIAQLVLRGKSNKEIEDELYISLVTVKSHIYRIYKKLGIKSRTELMLFFR